MDTSEKEQFDKLLPIAIMAHNEEKVIEISIESVMTQYIPKGYSIKIIVVANGCSDRTEEIVYEIAQKNPSKIELIAISDKGKTKAINKVICYFDEIAKSIPIPYVIFLDADCEFLGKDALINFVKQFDLNPQLCAIGADCLPDVSLNSRKDIVAQLYRAIYSFSSAMGINSISGMCYGIRLPILKRIDFPEFQFAEDMFITARVNGRFLKDKNIGIVFKTPTNLLHEIKRRTRQAISTQRYLEYYSYLKQKGVKVKLFEESLGSGYRWGKTKDCSRIGVLLGLKGIRSKVFVVGYFLIRIFAKVRAKIILRKLRSNSELDYWEVSR